MSVEWQKLRVPLLERLALLDLAERRQETEEETLARIIREAVIRECKRLERPNRPSAGKGQEVRP